MEGVKICAVCGREIGGKGSIENVYALRRVKIAGKEGWVAVHVRCAGKLMAHGNRRAVDALPGGNPLQLRELEGGKYGLGMA